MSPSRRPARGRAGKVTGRALAKRRREYAEEYLPLVEQIAKRLSRRLPPHVELDELVSAGMLGLMDAAGRFDPARDIAFPAFAEPRIRGAMLDWLRGNDTLSRDMRRISNELRAATRRLELGLGREPDQEELAASLGLSLGQLHDTRKKLSGASVIGHDDVAPNFLERLGDQAPSPEELVEHHQALGELVACIEDLPERMQQILALYYCEDMGLREIGEVLGVTESRVCQIHADATQRLRVALGRSAYR